jgi:cytochrome c553
MKKALEGWGAVTVATLGVAFALGTGSADAGSAEPGPAAPVTGASVPAPVATTGAAVPPRANIDWAKMSRAERKDYMKSVVLPKAQEMFTSFDPKQFKHVTCGTCHGDDYAHGTYKMPNADLPLLPSSARGFKELRDRSPEIVAFMSTRVKPTMAALLGLPEYSPANPQGFACFNCHMKGHERGQKTPQPGQVEP